MTVQMGLDTSSSFWAQELSLSPDMRHGYQSPLTKGAHAGEVVTLALVPVEATHTPAGVKGPAELDRQLIVIGSGVQAAGHDSMVHLASAG